MPNTIVLVVLALSGQTAEAQVVIKGAVYDRSQLFAMPGVSVLGTSGVGTVTDSTGHYRIRLLATDSIYFSYLGKLTVKFPVKEITYPEEFDMSLQVNIDSLQPVYIKPRNYEGDSLENRMEYEKIFDYGGPDVLDNMKSGSGMPGFGFNFDMLFDGARNRRMLAFQKRLLDDEHDNYVDYRFSRALVKRVTGLEAPALDTFMRLYRPSYDFIQTFATDYEYYEFILRSSKYFLEIWKQEHPD